MKFNDHCTPPTWLGVQNAGLTPHLLDGLVWAPGPGNLHASKFKLTVPQKPLHI